MPIGLSFAPVAPPFAPDDVEPLVEARPSWWRFLWLVVPWSVAIWRRASVVLRVNPGRIMLARVLDCEVAELLPRNARSVVPVLRQGEG